MYKYTVPRTSAVWKLLLKKQGVIGVFQCSCCLCRVTLRSTIPCHPKDWYILTFRNLNYMEANKFLLSLYCTCTCVLKMFCKLLNLSFRLFVNKLVYYFVDQVYAYDSIPCASNIPIKLKIISAPCTGGYYIS